MRKCSSIIVYFLLAIFICTSLVIATEYCTECGKKLKWGKGTCAACKLKALAETVKEIDKDLGISQKIEENRESREKTGTVHNFYPTGKQYSNDRKLIYINGMRTSFDQFKENSQELADLLGRPVTGVYAGGATQGMASSIAIQVENWTKMGPARGLPEGQALINEIEKARQENKHVDLVCHSRGTMVTEAVLRDYDWAYNNVTVYAFGCAVSGTFPTKSYYKIVNKDDYLMKDRMIDTRNLVWGPSGGHDFSAYLHNLRIDNYDTELPLIKSNHTEISSNSEPTSSSNKNYNNNYHKEKSGYFSTNLKGGLISYYTFDINTRDEIGNNDLTNNGVYFTNDGVINGCLEFGGGHIKNDNYSFPHNNEFSFSFWMWIDNRSDQHSYLISFNMGSGSYNRPFIGTLTNIDQDKIRSFVLNPTDNTFTRNYLFKYHEWTHVAYVYGQKRQSLYINGKKVFYKNNTTQVDYLCRFLMGDNTKGTRKLIGKIDELGMWNRVLTEREVDELYNNGIGLSFK
ncbi:MAG: LamG domain-containing protein [candidate division Zixibacteria bacterium]|nr:LamG domain-containing protein [candidate division Zixibacteria bacterium]